MMKMRWPNLTEYRFLNSNDTSILFFISNNTTLRENMLVFEIKIKNFLFYKKNGETYLFKSTKDKLKYL